MTNVYLGLDPGRNGGLAALSAGGVVLSLRKMPDNPEGVLDWIREQGKNGEQLHAALELVGGYMKSSGFQPGAHMFVFGMFAGWLEMALAAENVSRRVKVPAVSWQRNLRIPKRTKTESKPQYKRRLKAVVEKLFPNASRLGLTLATADALLLAEWCRRRFTGKLQKGLFS